uniref:ABC-three component systems C-terminal domain-containing protein n=1 Tax=Candidatus Kentrum sp. UNK TaxID=2126344 RepID=A0A451B2B5_9GAMM|nr:MAG: hypothetical protein BECKUNK1418G_GA0071005_106317 [Candidatus Kentron sp. UNK]VFK72416.1 MAG: hypothetical protein BECKUNK1418H_GA0071006_111311 [Candidatus Kentron sp. UNK]
MPDNNEFWFRMLFKVKLYEARGASFQQLVHDLFQLVRKDFQAIAPWGNWGDGGNDGWVPSKGWYYQIHGPEPGMKDSIKKQMDDNATKHVKKAAGDFRKLTEEWGEVKRYYFVLNDRYTGIPAPVAKALQDLEDNNEGLEKARAIGSRELENLFMKLSEQEREVIIGGIPGHSLDFIDPRCVGELLTHLADKSTSLSVFLDGTAPDFQEKIAFNGLTEPVAGYLKSFSYQAATVDDFLSDRGDLAQPISEEINRFYKTSRETIPNEEEYAPNMRYVWMVEQLIPDAMRKHPHSMKAYREAAQTILAKYFETCDAYDHPNSVATP